jgi:flagellar basal-body rod protein FlgF
MDRMIYVAMTGAQQLLEQQAVTAHNLANLGTSGYKADTTTFRVLPVEGPGLPTRAYALAASAGADLTPGSLTPTGRDLDIAIQGDGMYAVQGLDGNEAYTREGSLAISADGELQTHRGFAVIGEGGPINIPQDSKVTIGGDGTVSVVTLGQTAANVTVVGKLKLVNPAARELAKGGDGLFRTRGGAPADADPAVRLVSGALEGSNVSAVGAMVDMINLSRQFEMQMKLLQDVDGNEQRATQLLGPGAA